MTENDRGSRKDRWLWSILDAGAGVAPGLGRSDADNTNCGMATTRTQTWTRIENRGLIEVDEGGGDGFERW